MRIFKLLIMSALITTANVSASAGDNGRVAIKPDARIERQVKKILSRMTLEEKVGQMAEIGIDMLGNSTSGVAEDKEFILNRDALESLASTYKFGSVLNAPGKALTAEQWNSIIETINAVSIAHTGLPTLYGIDAIHGATYTHRSPLFPQEINAAASFNRAMVRRMAELTAYEVRASNIPWTYSPTMDLGRKASWPRVWESFGEDAYLSAEMAREMVLGYQGDDPNHIDAFHIASCPKHFMAYGMTNSGQDRTPAYVSLSELREKHFAPFKAAIEAGALSVMVNSASVNGIPTHADRELLTGWLKEGLGWDGVIVTDWADIVNLYTREKIATDYKDAIRQSVNAGVDMSMIPYDVNFCPLLVELVKEGKVSQERIDDAAARIIRMKLRLGLIDTPNTYVKDYPKFQGEEIRRACYEAACESITLLKNEESLLPLSTDRKILVAGPNADLMRPLCGGWSYSWQGDIVDKVLPDGITILDAMRSRGGDNIVYAAGVEYDPAGKYYDEKNIDIEAAVRAAADVDCIVLCLGENSYCETPGNLNEMAISPNQQALAKALAATGKPVVLVLNEGRARIIESFADQMQAVLHTYLPGTEGGSAIADIIYGRVNPSGKLPYTYPKYSNSMTTYDHKVSESVGTMEGAYDYNAVVAAQWAFGYGLSYTTFEYTDLKVESGRDFKAGDEIRIGVTVTNTGSRTGKESVLLFVNDDVASVVPDARRLRDFCKIELMPGESRRVTFTLPAERLAMVGRDARWYLEQGTYTVQCGQLVEKLNCTDDAALGYNI
ncbi:MAG: glycoside hydrolase family 3 C-terminal domain-containing protein [Alistipes sp.]|nr:glycoside hydrolase family 3 C-terminal domain-containing protein [Alistipes sp.]MDE7129800.1 glycoside hydrolase family 3 C-terminal domain-containing protein [Alistipes sp.]